MTTDPRDVVLDPFLGTGTTAIAAKTLSRHYVGIELDEGYVQIANDKLSRTVATTYRGFPVSKFLGKIATVRDVNAQKLFAPQLTSTEKKKLRANQNGIHRTTVTGKPKKEALMERLFEKKTPEANELPDDMPEVVQVTGEEVKLRKKQRRSINSPVRYSSKSQ